ncbi:hypothetical protein [Streptomyces sp. YIM 132580]|uniref:hypothetical protein n=1 Tax=Streptomyces sp. YIM 132580 TaxID=2691958 RepID=UPI0013721EA2|nr:hypothetical protein [Streptomyces sp. YIM 132580]MXG30503.1 hypothetical protein [Streptomyces sp. YIM 132580]
MSVNVPYGPETVYTPTPIHIGPGQALSVPQSLQQPSPYVIVQQAAPAPSWARQHAGQIVAAGGAGVLVVAVLLAVAVVAVAVGIGAISCAIGWLVIKTLMGSQTEK